MSKKARKNVPEDVAASILFMSDRTCCVCNERGKTLQIHHIDDNPSNNSFENLAVLCVEHHNETLLQGGFGRKLDAAQVRMYRDDWHNRVQARRDKLVNLNESQFKDFRPDFSQNASMEEPKRSNFSELESQRIDEYQRNHGLFLIHRWRPSDDPKEVADIVIRLHQHNLGPLHEEKVESVEYQLGPKFFTESVMVTDPTNGFQLEVSAYRPMLCLAKVHLIDDRSPITLSRFIDFPVE